MQWTATIASIIQLSRLKMRLSPQSPCAPFYLASRALKMHLLLRSWPFFRQHYEES
jgi:hypothetical protein